MDASDLAAIHAELRYITYILYVIGGLAVAALVLACLCAYWTVKRRANQWDTFTVEAEDLLKREQLDKLLTLASAKIQERPNYASGYWYLALALYAQGKYSAAIEQFERVRRLKPVWSVQNVDPYIQEARRRMEFL
jgi:cytochrome c-type biogenesis protein CcmH/NrfG